MKSSLVTTIKRNLVDPNASGLNEWILQIKPKTDTENCCVDMLFKTNSSVKVIGDSNMLSLNSDLSNLTNEITFSINERKVVYFASGDYYVSIYNKNEIEFIYMEGNIKFDLAEIPYLNKCLSLSVSRYNYYLYGDIGDLKYLQRYEGITDLWFSLGPTVSIELFQDKNTNIYGEVLDVAEGLFDRLGGYSLNSFHLMLKATQNCTINGIEIPGARECNIIYNLNGFSITLQSVWDTARNFVKQPNGTWIFS